MKSPESQQGAPEEHVYVSELHLENLENSRGRSPVRVSCHTCPLRFRNEASVITSEGSCSFSKSEAS